MEVIGFLQTSVSQVLSKRIVGYRYIAACPNLVRKLFYPV